MNIHNKLEEELQEEINRDKEESVRRNKYMVELNENKMKQEKEFCYLVLNHLPRK